MELLAATARDIGYWGDKLIGVAGITFCLIVIGVAKARSRRAGDAAANQMDEVDADRTADLQRSGPPRFNG
jgi:hypothetical protein